MIQFPHIIMSLLILLCFYCRPSLGNGNNDTVRCSDRERKALLQFKDGITSDFCGLLNSWRDDTDCCEWCGVQCSNDTGQVIKLHLQGSDLDNTCLVGKLSSSLGNLMHLRHLNLNFNYFHQLNLGFLGSLANLEYLSLGYFFVTSEVATIMPPLQESHEQGLNWLSRLRLLRHFQLNGADLSDANNWIHIVSQLPFLSVLRMDSCQLPAVNIPASLTHINSSSNLRVISLSDNGIDDNLIFSWLFSLPGITTRLEYLDLSSNSIKDLIPNGFENLKHLLYLDLSNNQLEGPVLKGFGSLKHLAHLDLSNNQLEGLIPTEFQNMNSLAYLSLSKNNLQGNIPKIFSRLCNLQKLQLGYNNFTDELTNAIQSLLSCKNTTLLTLDLSHNRFWGAIPDSISSFALLRELYLDGNQLNGGISQGMGQLALLEKLDVSSNSLNATLTHTHFLHLSKLSELYMSHNTKIVMNIDASWDPPFQLDIISLRSCKLGPYFPNWLQTQTNLSYLDISNAEISDFIPVSFWTSLSSKLNYLNMSHNQFRGMIPNLPHKVDFILPEVDLSANLFEGVVPSWFTNFTSLYLNDNRFSDSSDIFCPKTASSLSEVDLSNNLLSGLLQDCWMNFDELDSLHLENNKFYGNIPQSIGTMKSLQFLHLHNNSFSGPIPASLGNCTSLVILNLGYNSFTGKIPPWTGSVQSLVAVILRRNHFFGEIPSNLCQLPSLQILDYAMNHISGVIPRCIGNLRAMTGSAISVVFAGNISNTFGRQELSLVAETATVMWKREEQLFKKSVGFVRFIDFSYNELSGEIPDGIFNLTGLLSLDLSKNNLSGNISAEIGQLSALELLDLSDNHLKGAIPASLSSLTSLAILDLSNNNLSGKIPVGTQLQSFNASSYTGNPELCGVPLSTCPGDQMPVDTFKGGNTSTVQDEHHDNGVFPGLYISVVLGLIIGFWGVFGTLIINNSWRYAWFRLLDSIQDSLYVIAMGVVAWRKP